MNRKTLTDKFGDTLEIRMHGNGEMYVEASEDGETACAGPFTREQIVKALDEVDPDLASPDYADGGMAAAAIEKEAERRPSNLLAAYWLREYDRRDEDAKRWKEATRRAVQGQVGLRHELSLADMRAEKHRRAEVDHCNNARCWMKASEEWQATAEEWEARAERAVQERDQARADAASLSRQLHDAQQDADMSRTEMEAEPRPLTPDAITDSHVLSARLKANALGWFGRFDAPTEEWRQVLAAALTEPPSRPDGAEEIEVALYSALPSARLDEDEIKDLADALAGHLAGEGE